VSFDSQLRQAGFSVEIFQVNSVVQTASFFSVGIGFKLNSVNKMVREAD